MVSDIRDREELNCWSDLFPHEPSQGKCEFASQSKNEEAFSVKKNVMVLIIVIIGLVGASYYGYQQWKKLQPPPPDPNAVYNPYLPPPNTLPGNK